MLRGPNDDNWHRALQDSPLNRLPSGNGIEGGEHEGSLRFRSTDIAIHLVATHLDEAAHTILFRVAAVILWGELLSSRFGGEIHQERMLLFVRNESEESAKRLQ